MEDSTKKRKEGEKKGKEERRKERKERREKKKNGLYLSPTKNLNSLQRSF
jgi:hypothetical protein